MFEKGGFEKESQQSAECRVAITCENQGSKSSFSRRFALVFPWSFNHFIDFCLPF